MSIKITKEMVDTIVKKSDWSRVNFNINESTLDEGEVKKRNKALKGEIEAKQGEKYPVEDHLKRVSKDKTKHYGKDAINKLAYRKAQSNKPDAQEVSNMEKKGRKYSANAIKRGAMKNPKVSENLDEGEVKKRNKEMKGKYEDYRGQRYSAAGLKHKDKTALNKAAYRKARSTGTPGPEEIAQANKSSRKYDAYRVRTGNKPSTVKPKKKDIP